ncbi:MFS efflux transporter [Pseudohyphozyma bogoriensis]|nr:MFS efflux transporter [Pseudohyphozyma bogoriensis]
MASSSASPATVHTTPSIIAEKRGRWHPTQESAQMACVFAMIALVGMNDSAQGAQLSSMQAYYHVSSEKISLVFFANIAGYFLSCAASSYLFHNLGLTWALIVAAACWSAGSLMLSFAPPFPVFIISLLPLGFGSGHKAPDDEPAEVLPAGTLPSDIALEPASHSSSLTPNITVRQRMSRALKLRVVWAGFLLTIMAFAFLDILSGWAVSFLTEERHAPQAMSRYQLAGMWGAYLLSNKMGERAFGIVMLCITSAFLAVMWAVKNAVVDAVALAMVGFFIGPVAPRILSTVSNRVPPSLKSSVMSLSVGVGLLGSSGGPLLFGIIAGNGGLKTLPAVLIGTSAACCGGWLLVPSRARRDD